MVKAQETIQDILDGFPPESIVMVSGGCPKGGVDEWAERIATELDVPRVIFEPEKEEWKYYKKRNIEIVEFVDILICIEPMWVQEFGAHRKYFVPEINAFCRRSGGTWTLDRAKIEGKLTKVIVIL